jgi:hypothetical protein
MPPALGCRVHSHLRRGQREDQPSATRVDASQIEHAAEERPVRFGV